MLQKFRAMAPALLLIAGALVLLITPVGRAAAGVALLAAGLAFLLTPLCAALEKGLPRPLSAALCVILTAIFGVWGFAGGLILCFAICASTHTVLGGSYLYPLIPFDWQALSATLVRRKRRDDD